MGFGGGDSGEVKETSQQKAAAEVAQKQWQLYQSQLKPYEDKFIKRTDKLNDPREYEKAAAIANIGGETAFSQVRQQQAKQLAASGADPSSGRFATALQDVADDQNLSTQDNINRYQVSQADKYVAGLQDVSALGQGQKADALAGYNSLAQNSITKAYADADATRMRRDGQMSLAGSLVGAAGAGVLGYSNGAFSKPHTGDTNMGALQRFSRVTPGTTALQNLTAKTPL